MTRLVRALPTLFASALAVLGYFAGALLARASFPDAPTAGRVALAVVLALLGGLAGEWVAYEVRQRTGAV